MQHEFGMIELEKEPGVGLGVILERRVLAGDRIDRRGHRIEVGRPEAAHRRDDGRGRLVVLALLYVVDDQPSRGRRELPARVAPAAVAPARARISRALMSQMERG